MRGRLPLSQLAYRQEARRESTASGVAVICTELTIHDVSCRHLAVALTRYLRWYVLQPCDMSHDIRMLIQYDMIRLGVKTCAFHLGDYRRTTVGPGKDVPDDYFFVNGS